jgi:ribosome biogenesis GTPase
MKRGMSLPLSHLGYCAFFADQMKELSKELVPARVVGQHRREWDVSFEGGISRAFLAGRLWDPVRGVESADAQPTVGDWVALRLGEGDSLPVIEHILMRRTWLSRGSLLKKSERQSIVANIDHVAVVAAFAPPGCQDAVVQRSLHPRRIERYLTAIQKGGAQPLVILNKADLSSDSGEKADKLRVRLNDCRVVCASAKTDNGLASLRSEFAPGETVGFVGLSGVGKSSLINRFLGQDVQKVRSQRTQDARGRHVTTHRELFTTDDGVLLIDTPGMREFAVAGASNADLSAFSDITQLASECQFRDCKHKNEPGCRVLSSVAAGKVSRDRLENFRTLSDELFVASQAMARKRGPGRPRPQEGRRSSRWDED